ncbi:MAG: hypothetical protein U0S12_13685 [Fimbriimonadales bacterium]
MSTWSLAAAMRPGIAAVKSHWRPLLVIQVFAAALVLAYYQSQAVRDALQGLSDLKARSGILFAFVAGFLAGGVFPEIAKLLVRQPNHRFADAMFNGFAYGTLGILIDRFYILQGVWFGHGIDIGTLVKKNLVDMGLAAPIVFIPYVVGLFEWRRKGHREAAKMFSWLGYRDKVLPAMLPNWAFWIPVLFCVYAMPPNLQFSLSTLAEAAWSIVFVFIATNDH